MGSFQNPAERKEGILNDQALPLEGIRIIELCQAFSGPITGLYLADLGAEVI